MVYSESEKATVERCLKAVEAQAKKREAEGLTANHFFLGVVNFALIVYFYAGYQEHLWLLYAVEAAVIMPMIFYNWATAKPTQTSYLFDFCWVANFVALGILAMLLLDRAETPEKMAISPTVRRYIFLKINSGYITIS